MMMKPGALISLLVAVLVLTALYNNGAKRELTALELEIAKADGEFGNISRLKI